ncbi:hypothetical protein AVEN_217455-1 [Araneus ventricosus]|uniref:BTB domain-containing protein n=1 Tax=Araneus ventricosus TaxID=182803 RepID=A0A4Y1ZSC4_ARAVE|nr:hypothetical protein AVEN_217455-1 [Araneus ventricosus]
MAESDMQLESFSFKLDKNIIHLKTCCGKNIHYLCAWYIPNFSSEQPRSSEGFRGANGVTHSFKLEINPFRAHFSISSAKEESEWDISVSTHSGKVPLRENILTVMMQELLRLDRMGAGPHCSVDIVDEDFQKLHNSSGIITCRMILSTAVNPVLANISSSTSARNSEYLKSLEADLKNYSIAFSKEKVSLRVGQETEMINKAVLCARSPVFAKMFGNDIREHKNNTITITDIKMPVLRSLVSFLCSGLLPDCDFNFLCDLYYAAKKYDIRELHQACIKLFLYKITLGNIVRVLKLSSSYNDDLLMSAAMTLISANIETVALTSDWKDLMCDDPEMALKASTFFDF